MAIPVPSPVGRRNARLLVQLRWLAVFGQLAAILTVHAVLGAALPIWPMLGALAVLVALNLAVAGARGRWPRTERQVFATLLVDAACLTVQLYLSGGVANPFVSLYLLQVVLAAVLLPAWAGWATAGLTSALFALLAATAPEIRLPAAFVSELSAPYVAASWFNYTLAAMLLVLFVTRIVRNLSERDAWLARLRQRAAEEEHVVRMGLLASGAAHELGTPLSSIAVMLGDWQEEPAIAASPALSADLADMRSEVMRCKQILGNILLASGEVRGEGPVRTTLAAFLDGIVTGWRGPPSVEVEWRNFAGSGTARVVSDKALAQTIQNLLDNAAEAGATHIAVTARRDGAMLELTVEDDGSGFTSAILANLGKPNQSTKERRGAGVGLFLAGNVLRTLGGTLEAGNRAGGGAMVRIALPLAALTIGEDA
jgi:two-component system sensor histidine kinase RegB